MVKPGKWITRMCALASLAVLSVSAFAFIDDASILIDRAINSPTVTVRYSSAPATMVELKVNGTSFGTRSVSSVKNRGETSFTLDLSALADGDNQIEVLLFDKAGKLLGTQKSVITTDTAQKGPVFLKAPKMGATVMGPVQIEVGFGKDLKNTYVNFFVDNQFKSLLNTPPYTYLWDTTREANGWHELEAWVVDDSTNTFKTRKTKVFVSNPGGHTVRVTQPADPAPTTNPLDPKVKGGAGIKTGTGVTTPVDPDPNSVTPKLGANGSQNDLTVGVVGRQDVRAPKVDAKTSAFGPNNLVPTHTHNAGTRVSSQFVSAPPKNGNPGIIDVHKTMPKTSDLNASTSMIRVSYGKRLPAIGTYEIVLNARKVNFDVAPRVQDGIPLTPFRALFEQAGGKVDWEAAAKAVSASGLGRDIYIKIGDKVAHINKIPVDMEMKPFIEKGRTIVPLSFIQESLDVNVDYDPATGHVLITSVTKK